MSSLFLVRHGQASLGADDYDQLSDLGHRQAQRLGAWWQAAGQEFSTVFIGSLRRHAQTWAGIAAGLGLDPTLAQVRPALDEYLPESLIAVVRPDGLPPPRDPAAVREHFLALREGLAAWMDDGVQPQGMPDFAAFQAGLADVMAEAGAAARQGPVLVVSSGGPISTALGTVLGLATPARIELNLRMRNTAVSEVLVRRQPSLITFNTLPHLNEPHHADWISLA